MLKLNLQYFGHLMQRADSLEKTLMLGKIEGRRKGRQCGCQVLITRLTGADHAAEQVLITWLSRC